MDYYVLICKIRLEMIIIILGISWKIIIIKAKFGGFGYVTKGKIRGQGNRGAGNLEDGIPIYFERQNTPGNIVQRSAQIVFPTQKAADTF